MTPTSTTTTPPPGDRDTHPDPLHPRSARGEEHQGELEDAAEVGGGAATSALVEEDEVESGTWRPLVSSSKARVSRTWWKVRRGRWWVIHVRRWA